MIQLLAHLSWGHIHIIMIMGMLGSLFYETAAINLVNCMYGVIMLKMGSSPVARSMNHQGLIWNSTIWVICGTLLCFLYSSQTCAMMSSSESKWRLCHYTVRSNNGCTIAFSSFCNIWIVNGFLYVGRFRMYFKEMYFSERLPLHKRLSSSYCFYNVIIIPGSHLWKNGKSELVVAFGWMGEI